MSKKDYQRIGWRICFLCQQSGYAYRYKGRTYVKHPVSIDQAQQLTFVDSGLQLQQKKQRTCYISKKSGHHYAIVCPGDRRLKQGGHVANSTIVERPRRMPAEKIAVFPGDLQA